MVGVLFPSRQETGVGMSHRCCHYRSSCLRRRDLRLDAHSPGQPHLKFPKFPVKPGKMLSDSLEEDAIALASTPARARFF